MVAADDEDMLRQRREAGKKIVEKKDGLSRRDGLVVDVARYKDSVRILFPDYRADLAKYMGLFVDEGLFIDSFAYMQVGYVYKLHFPSLILDKDTEKMIYICGANSLYMERKILIVDDEADIREILQFNLENAGYTADCAASAEEALEILGPEHGLILLDVMMGGMSGFAMAKMLRTELDNQIPIIFLTAKTTENDLLTGFSAGGDDYIPKPFSIHEVIARVRAVLRRMAPVEAKLPTMLECGRLKIDMENKMVYIDGEKVVFSKKEFEVLSLLASNAGKIYSREDLISELWKDAPYVLDRTVDVHIARIRSKLGACKGYLTNRSGFGYIFNPVD